MVKKKQILYVVCQDYEFISAIFSTKKLAEEALEKLEYRSIYYVYGFELDNTEGL